MARKNTAAVAGIGVLSLVALTGCSSISTEPDQVALHYTGGSFSSRQFEACIPASKREMNGPGDKYYAYPTSQRTYDATSGKASESGAVTVVSSDNAELRVPATVTFTLITDCDTLRQFHERIGNRYQAYWGGEEFVDENNDKAPDGWVTMLNLMVGKPLDTSLDRAAQGYQWRQLWNDPATKTKVEQSVTGSLQSLIDQQMGGKFIDVSTVLIQKPDPVNEDLKNAVAAEQAAVAKAKSAEAEAGAQKAAAEAQVAVAKAQAAQIAEQIRVLGEDGYLKKYAIDKGITPWPAPVAFPVAAK